MSLHREIRGDGPDIVFLHGWGMNAAVWGDVATALEQRFRLHLIEMPGHGHSAYHGETGLSEWAQACLDAAPDRAIWMGWSLGGQVALQAALLEPQRIDKLVLTATAPRFVQSDDWPNAMPLGTLGQFAAALSEDYHGTINRFLALQVRGSEKGREVLRLLKQDLVARPEADSEALSIGLRLLRESDLRSSLRGGDVPSLWLFGDKDALVPAAMAGDVSRLSSNDRVEVIEGAGHAPFLSHSDEWLMRVESFLL